MSSFWRVKRNPRNCFKGFGLSAAGVTEREQGCLTYRNCWLCQDFLQMKKRRKIKGLVGVAPQGVTPAVKAFVQVVQVYAIGIMLCNMCMRDMRGATGIMRECVSSCYVWHICGRLCECWCGRWSSGLSFYVFLCHLFPFYANYSIYQREACFLRGLAWYLHLVDLI